MSDHTKTDYISSSAFDTSPPESPTPMSPPISPSGRPFRAKRNRTLSESEKILAGPTFYGRVEEFCRQKGHGFIIPCDGGDKLFVHISDIEGDLVPKEGDEVSYKLCPIPPKNQKYSAVHVQIVHPKCGVLHETWETSGSNKTALPNDG